MTTLKITQVRSAIGGKQNQRATLLSLGLRKISQSVVRDDTPQIRGMALAVEPMLTAGDPETRELDDGWTVVTADGSRAAHWEHSVAVTDDGPRILTLPAD